MHPHSSFYRPNIKAKSNETRKEENYAYTGYIGYSFWHRHIEHSPESEFCENSEKKEEKTDKSRERSISIENHSDNRDDKHERCKLHTKGETDDKTYDGYESESFTAIHVSIPLIQK